MRKVQQTGDVSGIYWNSNETLGGSIKQRTAL